MKKYMDWFPKKRRENEQKCKNTRHHWTGSFWRNKKAFDGKKARQSSKLWRKYLEAILAPTLTHKSKIKKKHHHIIFGPFLVFSPPTVTHQCLSVGSGSASLRRCCVFGARRPGLEQRCWLERWLSGREAPSRPPWPWAQWRAPAAACCRAQRRRDWVGSPDTSASLCYLWQQAETQLESWK